MGLVLFTVSGCSRCAVVGKFLRERGIACEERDALGEGKTAFAEFYRAHRGAIARGREGVEFPVLSDGDSVRQGLGPVLASLQGGARLEAFFRCAEAPRGWVSGIEISAGDARAAADFFAVLEFLKREGLKLEAATDGRNAALLEELFRRDLADRVVMRLHGPPDVHRETLGGKTGIEEIEAAMTWVCRFREYRFETPVVCPSPGTPAPGGPRPLTPEEVAATARWLREATGSHRQPYVLVPCPAAAAEPPSSPAPACLVRHRSAARTFQVLTEIAPFAVR
ncbi:MAG: hypothetical protein WHT06_05680 [Desulfobacterales bacterium]